MRISVIVFLCVISGIFFAGIVCGCSPSVQIHIDENGSAAWSVHTQMSGVVENMIRGITSLPEDASLFDVNGIQDSLMLSGVSSVSVSAAGTSGIDISATFPSLQFTESLAPGLLSIKENEAAGSHVCSFSSSPEILGAILKRLPAETSEYIDLLMAPAVTGEQMSETEYVSLISAVYGSAAASELAGAVLSVEITVPASIISAEVSLPTAQTCVSEKTVTFTIPFCSFLSENEQIVFCIQY